MTPAVAVETEVKTICRVGTLEDLPEITRMFSQFMTSTKYVKYIGDRPDVAIELFRRMLTNPDMDIFVAERGTALVGMLGVMAYTHPLGGRNFVSEVFWWLDPNHRGYGGWLLRRAEKWARARGAERMQMVAPSDNERVGEMYERGGYERVETLFQKDLS